MDTRNRGANSVLLSSIFLLCQFFPAQYCCTTIDIITSVQPLSQGQTLTSSSQKFELGFFRPNNSSQYIGIWYKNLFPRKVVWVANREKPLSATDTLASLTIGSDGNLKLLDGNLSTLWATNVTTTSNNSISAKLLDNGNLVLGMVSGAEALWESFNHPSDTFMANMSIGMNTKTGEKHFFTSWKREDDPSPGNFVFGMVPRIPPECFIWINGSTPYVRSGQWDGSKFIGLPEMDASYLNGHEIHQDTKGGTAYLTVDEYNSSKIIYTVMSSQGVYKVIYWDEGKGEWLTNWETPKHPCDIYGACGHFGVCKQSKSPICTCLKGFVPKSSEEWSKGNWSGGCVRRTELFCRKNTSRSLALDTRSGKEDGFWKMVGMKLPDLSEFIDLTDAPKCQKLCLSNCSCMAYAFVGRIGCMIWDRDLIDVQEFSFAGESLFLRLAHSELGEKNQTAILIISSIVASSVIILGTVVYCYFRWKSHQRGGKREEFVNGLDYPKDPTQENVWRNHGNDLDLTDLPKFDLDNILAATNNFSITNKLGQGGFGPVYKGKLQGGKEIAVKRLSNFSRQGDKEFKSEIILISKLQHRNLARLLGYCIKAEEKLLIYEYLSNKSLDAFLFDPTKRAKLDWAKRLNIIQGIARGLLYLHRDSCLRVIHRDLKLSNILLDEYLTPKISDFGMARTFEETQDLANTHRVVGTFGYMAPEYVMKGIFSEKSDVYSFGVLLLEIVSGKKNTSFHYRDQHLNLLDYVWELWNQHKGLDFLDDSLAADSFSSSEVIRCVHVGLLCVQNNAEDRPVMPAVVSMLSTETDRPRPKQPPFTHQNSWLDHNFHSQCNKICSLNDVTQSTIEGR